MKHIVMLGTRLDTMGGIASVVAVYRDSGFLATHRIRYIATHCDGGTRAKLAILLRALGAFWGLLLRGRVALLHVHTSSRASFWRKLLFFVPAFLARIPVLLHLHGSEFAVFHDQECGPLRRWIVRAVFDRCARVLVLSSAWQRWVQGMCGNRHVVVLFNPVQIPDEAAPAEGRRPQLLFLGRIGLRKGAFDLVEAMVQVARAVPAAQLLMGGDGEVDQARARAAEAGVADRLHCLGWVRGAQKQALFAQSSVFVLPSYHEGLPMGILEAMASGLAIVSTPVGGIPDAVRDGVEGFLVPPGDVPALADRLTRLLQDEPLCARMGQAARARAVSQFSTTAVLPQLSAVYAELGAGP